MDYTYFRDLELALPATNLDIFVLPWVEGSPITRFSTASPRNFPPCHQNSLALLLHHRPHRLIPQPYASTQSSSEVTTPFHPVLTLDFLRKSRQYSDDSIETHLNALLPPRRLFSTPTPTVLEPPHCQDFIRSQLLPTWTARDDLLTYCSTLAEKSVEKSEAPVTPVVEVSERLDPYARRKKEVWEKHDELRRIIRQERGVESVIRLRTWDIIVRRCQLEGVVEGWEDELARWKAAKKQ